MSIDLRCGDSLEVLRSIPDASIDSCVTDPPYGLAFMGKRWDYDVPSVELWREVWRVLKPGAHLLSFSSPRTYHRMTVAIEDAGFEIRDQIMWIFGSGFPKSLNVSKAIDAHLGAESIVIGPPSCGNDPCNCGDNHVLGATKHPPATAPATAWEGWGTALKPAHEPVCVARKPLDGTVAANVLEHGTGALNIDACRIGFAGEGDKAAAAAAAAQRLCHAEPGTPYGGVGTSGFTNGPASLAPYLARMDAGRWPANVIHDGSAEVVAAFPQQKSGANPTRRGSDKFRSQYGEFAGQRECNAARGADAGSAARFFYTAKAARGERDSGLDALPNVAGSVVVNRDANNAGINSPRAGAGRTAKHVKNHHPTVKPLDLMRYLCRLVTPPRGIVLDPFMGSGTTGWAARLEGFSFIGIDRESEYVEIARRRIAGHAPLFDAEKPAPQELQQEALPL